MARVMAFMALWMTLFVFGMSKIAFIIYDGTNLFLAGSAIFFTNFTANGSDSCAISSIHDIYLGTIIHRYQQLFKYAVK